MPKIIITIIGIIISIAANASTNDVTSALDAQYRQNGLQGPKGGTVNGRVPAEKIGSKSRKMLDKNAQGVNYRVDVVVRDPGFRSAVHYHLFPIATCVRRGVTTLVLEGHKDHPYSAGECFIMPPYVKGYNANRGTAQLELVDFLASKPGTPYMVPLE